MSPQNYFNQFDIQPVSVSTARNAIEDLKPLISDLVENFHKFKANVDELVRIATIDSSIDEILQARYQVDLVEDRLAKLRREINAHNVVLRNWKKGLVDFGSIREGKPVWLCFGHGETELNHYHDFTSGFDERKAIDFD